MKIRNFLWVFIPFIFSTHLHAKQYEDLDQLVLLSENYLKEQMQTQLTPEDYEGVKISSGTLDSRLKLHQCDKALTFEYKKSSSIKRSVSIKVLCHSPHAWSIYTKHNISLYKNLVIATRPLPKNHIVQENDIAYLLRDINRERSGYITDKNVLIGQQLKRSLASGKIVYLNQLQRPDVVKKGDRVSVIAKMGMLSVITPGIALKDGRIGDQIEIENKRSSRIIQARIITANTVEVIL